MGRDHCLRKREKKTSHGIYPQEVRDALRLPAHLDPVSLLAIGHAGAAPSSPSRHVTERIPMGEFVL